MEGGDARARARKHTHTPAQLSKRRKKLAAGKKHRQAKQTRPPTLAPFLPPAAPHAPDGDYRHPTLGDGSGPPPPA